MSTEYTLIRNKCKCCGRGEAIQIGLSCGGWYFMLNSYIHDNNCPKVLLDWLREFDNGEIQDEYGRIITKEEMIKIICDREQEEGVLRPEWLQENHAKIGIKNLVYPKDNIGVSKNETYVLVSKRKDLI